MRASPRVAIVAVLTLVLAVAAVGAQPSIRAVAVAGDPAPGGGTFEHFGVESLPVVTPANTKGQVAFFATLLRATSSEAFFLASESRTLRVVTEGDPVPGGGALSGFGRHPIPALNERGDVAFAAAVTGGPAGPPPGSVPRPSTIGVASPLPRWSKAARCRAGCSSRTGPRSGCSPARGATRRSAASSSSSPSAWA